MPFFSDWRGLSPPDWSTNVPVSNYYTGGQSRSLRNSSSLEFVNTLAGGDTLLLGIDGYSLTPLSSKFIPRPILEANYFTLLGGGVVYLICYRGLGKDSLLVIYEVIRDADTTDTPRQ